MAILGASGSGKSTLLGLLAGLDDTSAGDIWLCGRALNGLSEDGRAELRAGRVGFVFQSFQLLPTLTARENVLLPLELAGNPDAQDRADQALERVGLTGAGRSLPPPALRGEQQRVAIARAYAPRPRSCSPMSPPVTSDQATGDQRSSTCSSDLRAEAGAALVLVTHDERLAERCDRRLRMRERRPGCHRMSTCATDPAPAAPRLAQWRAACC